MKKYIGMEIENLKKLFESENIQYEILEYDDKKMTLSDTVRVLRITKDEEKMIVIATKFYFRGEKWKCQNI